jgi:hypothetical protein
MFARLTTSLIHPAAAQGREDEVRVDPLYLEYLEKLDEMDRLLPPDDHGQPQIWDGQVGFVDAEWSPLGTIFVGGLMPNKQELWFMPAEVDLGAAFGMVHEGAYPPGTEGQILAVEQPGWDLQPCFDMAVKYKQLPNAALTADLDYEPEIDRFHFMLVQDGAIVGRMLREYQHVTNMPEKIVDHWAFFDNYVFPSAVDEDVWVVPAEKQFATTTEFFESMNLDAAIWMGFAQVQYRQKLGYQCLAALSF